jgi:TetR/AcrR family transcriptional regulator, transcriptional repressor of aconitase
MIVLFDDSTKLSGCSSRANVRSIIGGVARVSPEHLDARRRQILDAARRCFVRNGFHATSMQDILREANLSAGAVYRYFKSKDEIIAAIGFANVAAFTAAVREVLQAGDPLPLDEAFGRLLVALERLDEEQDQAKITLQAWSEALRSPVLAARVEEGWADLTGSLAGLVETYQERGDISSAVPADHIARVVVGLLHGFVVRHAVLGNGDAEAFRSGLRALAPGPQATPHVAAS